MSEIAREAHTLRSELEQAERERDLATAQLSMVGSEICSDPKMDPMDYRDPRWTPTLEEAAKLRAEAERLRGLLGEAIELVEDVLPYKSENLARKHRNHEDLARLRAALAGEGEVKP